MSTHRIRDRFPYGPAQPEELPPETHWMDYDTLEEVYAITNGVACVPVNFKSRAFLFMPL